MGPKQWVGCYLGPAMEHYRNVEIFLPRTWSIRTCNMVTFFLHSKPFLQVNLRNHLRQAAIDIVTLLHSPPNATIPKLSEGGEKQEYTTGNSKITPERHTTSITTGDSTRTNYSNSFSATSKSAGRKQ